MNYQQTLQYIWSIKKYADKIDLQTMEIMMAALGNPQNGLNIVHVAGTNGKGSVCNYIAASLKAAGYRTGLYLSPFLEVFNERMRVDDVLISDEDIVRLAKRVKAAADHTQKVCGRFPKQFEFVTAVAFLYFAEQKCDYVVLETGMGGLLDATNIIKKPLVSVITSIGLDHTHVLGNTVEEIAGKKSGIIKPGCPVVCDSFMNEAAIAVLEKAANEMQAPFSPVSKEALFILSADMEGITFSYSGETYQIHMLGEHQTHNCALAVTALRLLNIPEDAIKQGVASVRFSGRMERLLPNVLADGAHNEMGIRSLMEAIHFHQIQDVKFIISIGKEKEYAKMLSVIFEQAPENSSFFFCSFDENMAVNPDELCRFAASKGVDSTAVPTIFQVADMLFEGENSKKTYVLCGSLYFIGGVKNELKSRTLHKKIQN